jgi:hypothetical protein
VDNALALALEPDVAGDFPSAEEVAPGPVS